VTRHVLNVHMVRACTHVVGPLLACMTMRVASKLFTKRLNFVTTRVVSKLFNYLLSILGAFLDKAVKA